VEDAFHVEGLSKPVTIGPMQPFTGANLGIPWLLMTMLLFVLAIGLAVMLPGRTVLEKTFDLASEPPVAGGPDNGRISFSEPFDLTGRHNLVVKAYAPISNTWVSISGDLVEESTGGVYSFEFPIEYYSGVDGGESWSEGSQRKSRYLARPDAGRYTLRLESQWEPGKSVPPVQIVVREGVFRWPYFILAFLAISVFPILALIRRFAFESERWKDSSHSPFQSVTSGDEDEEE
jgi:hypothetical protein